MVRAAFVVVALAVGLTGALAPVARGGLYPPDEPRPFPVRPDGVAEPLPFPEFQRRLLVLTNVAMPTPLTEDRTSALAKAAALRRTPNPTADQTVSLAVRLLRLRAVDEALNRLQPLARDRRPSFAAMSALAHVHAARGEWAEAFDNQFAALNDAGFPPELAGYDGPQRDWSAAIEERYVLPYFRLRRQEPARGDVENEDVPPLFPPTERGKPAAPVRFVNDAGQYQPGTLAAAERAKLPADATAIVQQLVLWFPEDSRLFWLLGELYAADGELGVAQTIFDQLVDSRQFSNRKLVMEHRAAVRTAAEAKAKADEQAAADAFPVSLRAVAVYFIAVAAVFAVAVARSLGRRSRDAGCGPVG